MMTSRRTIAVLSALMLATGVGAFTSCDVPIIRSSSVQERERHGLLSAATTSDETDSESSQAPPATARSPTLTIPPPSSSTASTSLKTGVGQWEEMEGNYILRPPADFGQPRALIHFLGGALVGAAPDITYRYVLEELAQEGYLIVATPYNLSFDHLQTCDAVISKFERVAPALARQYGAIPVVGVGHSCGSLLHILITSLFPDTPRAANALLSFNNKPVQDAVPLFSEVVAPFFSYVADRNGTRPSGTDGLNIGLDLARAAARGDLPSDELLNDAIRFVLPEALASAEPGDVKVPPELRDALKGLIEPAATAFEGAGVLPLMDQTIDVLEQIPLLVEEVANGARDFIPPPSATRAAARRAYRARRTLLLQYDNDPLDESEEIEELLREAETVMRMKRPMIAFDIQRRVLKGGHAAPVLAPPLDLAEKLEDVLGADTAKERLLYAEADATVKELLQWLDEGQL